MNLAMLSGGSVEPEGRGTNLVVLVIIALATFLIPVVQRWLRQRAERAGAPPWEEGAEDPFSPYPGMRSDEPEAHEERFPRSLREEDVEEREPAKPSSPEAKTLDAQPLLQPAEPTPRRVGHSLEERLFAHRRCNAGAKLIIANALLERPKCFRRTP